MSSRWHDWWGCICGLLLLAGSPAGEEFFFQAGLSSGFGIVDLAPIPQPATPALLGAALLGMLWFRRRW